MSVNGWRSGGGGSTAGLASLAGAAFVGDVTTARLGAGSAATWSTVEKFRVNTPVTAVTSASAMIAAGSNTEKPLIVQGAAGHTNSFFEVQNSGGSALFYINSAGATVASGAIISGTVTASAGQIRLPNNTSVNWRNAANSADIGLNMSSSNVLTLSATSIALAAAGLTEVSVDANGLTMTDGKHFIAGTSTGSKIGSGSTQKIGFWGATAVVQPTTAGAAATFTANSGTAVNDASTFDGYTLSQVVKALRTIGILA